MNSLYNICTLKTEGIEESNFLVEICALVCIDKNFRKVVFKYLFGLRIACPNLVT